MSEDRTRKTLEGVSAFLRGVDAERFTRAVEAVSRAVEAEAPLSAAMDGATPFLGGGGRWLHMRMTGPDFSSLANARAHAAATLEPAALEPATTRAEPEEDKRFALIEVGERDP